MHKFFPATPGVRANIREVARIEVRGVVAVFKQEPTQADGEAMAMGLDVATHLQRFRDLRLSHYKQALSCTKAIGYAERQRERLSDGRACNSAAVKKLSERIALLTTKHSNHMTAVQTLNILFPVGDNVEGDMPA